MAVKVKDNEGVVRTLPEVSEVGARIDLKVGNEATRAQGVEGTLQTSISGVDGRVTTIEGKIPAAASTSNQLVDKATLDNAIQSNSATRVSYDAKGSLFPTRAALMGASTFYASGAPYDPKKNDYALVAADEGAPKPFTGGQTRFEYSGTVWEYAYGISQGAFTPTQQAAIDSGITAELVAKITPTETKANANESAISTLQTTVSELDTNYDNLSLDLDTAEATIANHTEQIGSLTTRVTAAEGKITTAEGKISTLQTSMTQAGADIDALQETVGTLETSVETLETTVGGHGTRLTAVEGKVTTLEGTVGSHTSSISALQKSVSTLETTVSDMEITHVTLTEDDWNGTQTTRFRA